MTPPIPLRALPRGTDPSVFEKTAKATNSRWSLRRQCVIWRKRLKRRRDLRALVFASDSVLEDAGLTREELMAELDRPFWRK